MRGMIGMREIRVGMVRIPGIRVEMREIGVGVIFQINL